MYRKYWVAFFYRSELRELADLLVRQPYDQYVRSRFNDTNARTRAMKCANGDSITFAPLRFDLALDNRLRTSIGHLMKS